MGKPDTFPEKFHGVYDIVQAVSCVGQGHIGSEIFDEMVLAAKPQGYCIFTTKFSAWDTHNYEARLAEMEEQGLWKKIIHTDHIFVRQLKLASLFVHEGYEARGRRDTMGRAKGNIARAKGNKLKV